MFITRELSQYESENLMPVGKKVSNEIKERAQRLRLIERLTLAQIGERLGVSIAVVSRAIGPSPKLRKEKTLAVAHD